MRRLNFPAAVFVVVLALLTNSDGSHGKEKSPSERWESAIQKFEQQDRKEMPPKGEILFVGSSSIRLWDLKKSFPDLKTINRGFGGSEIADSIHFADRIIVKHEPRIVVLYAGDNDIKKGKSAEQVIADFRAFANLLRGKLPQTKVVFIAIKPSISRWNLVDKMRRANSEIRSICEQDKLLEFVDIDKPMIGNDGMPRPELFAKDGLHLNAEGYRLWTKHVAGALK